MKLAFEAPIDGALMGIVYSDFIFAIAPMFKHERYKTGVNRGRQLGKELWLDNGAYEDVTFTPKDLLALCYEIAPDVVVAPDVIEDMKETLRLTEEFVDVWEVDPPCEARIMGVVQGKNREERERCFYKLVDLGINTFGLPLRGFQKDADERRRFYQEYSALAPGYYHLLSTSGYNDILSYRDEPVTLDTSLPFLCAQNGMLLPCDRPDTTLDWDRCMTDAEIALTAKNMEILWYGTHLH